MQAEIYWVELESDLEVRLERNKTPNRLNHKPSKRNLDFSEQNILDWENQYRMHSLEGEMAGRNFLKINNTDVSAEAVAAQIKSHFKL